MISEEELNRQSKLNTIKTWCLQFTNGFLLEEIDNFCPIYLRFIPDEIVISGGIMHNIFHGTFTNVKDIDVFLLAGKKMVLPSLQDDFTHTGQFEVSTASTIPERPDHVKFSGILMKKYQNFNSLMGYISLKVNIIVTTFSDRKELTDSFDMQHTRMAFTSKPGSSYMRSANPAKGKFILDGNDVELVYSDSIYHCIENKLIMKNPRIKGEIKPYRIENLIFQGWKHA